MTTPKSDWRLCFRRSGFFRHNFLWAVVLSLGLLALGQNSDVDASKNADQKKKSHVRPYSLLFGTVWGPDNRPVYGVKVKIRRAEEKKARWELYSDHNGEFAQRLPVGKADYVVWADLKDHKSPDGKHLQTGEEAKIHIDYDERVDTGLHLIQ